MLISGSGITPFVAKTKTDFRISTGLAIRWFQLSDGNWTFTDRGATVDTYETQMRLYGIKGPIEQFISEIEANRAAGSNQINISLCSENEKVFGADVVYNSITATVLDTLVAEQNRLKSWSVQISLRAIAPTFTGTATFPTLKYLNVGYKGSVEDWTIRKVNTYNGVYSYQDHLADSGVFEGTFQFTDTELRNLRRYMAVNRGATVTISEICGVTNPFGVTRPGYPINVKILDLTGEEQRGIGNWYATLRLGEVI
jgi:hypothetical protein